MNIKLVVLVTVSVIVTTCSGGSAGVTAHRFDSNAIGATHATAGGKATESIEPDVSATSAAANGSTKANPSLSFRPRPENRESSLIWYKASDETTYRHLIDDVDEFLKEYRETKNTGSDLNGTNNSHYGKVSVDPYPCTKDNYYNYQSSGPCIFLKLDKVHGWKPVLYNYADNLPSEMPEDLKRHIEQSKTKDPDMTDQIWVSCAGENPADIENVGPIRYLHRGFPYEDNEHHLSPVVALNFERPLSGVLIQVKCRVWARNIGPEEGAVRFELLID